MVMLKILELVQTVRVKFLVMSADLSVLDSVYVFKWVTTFPRNTAPQCGLSVLIVLCAKKEMGH